MVRLYTHEIAEAIINAGHTYSPEADGKYIMRNCDVRDIVVALAKFLMENGVDIIDVTRKEKYSRENGGKVNA